MSSSGESAGSWYYQLSRALPPFTRYLVNPAFTIWSQRVGATRRMRRRLWWRYVGESTGVGLQDLAPACARLVRLLSCATRRESVSRTVVGRTIGLTYAAMFYAMATQVETLKQKAHALIDQLPDDATWRDVAYRAAVRGDIEAGLADSAADRVTPLDELLKELDLDSA